MEVNFRIADNSDIDLLVEFVREFYEHEGNTFDRDVARTALTDLVDDLSLGRVWLILDKSEAIGYVALTIGYSLEHHGRDAFLDELFIKAGHRGQGIGAKAMQLVEAYCRELGIQALHLEVEPVNTRAQKLYRKAGFQDHDRYLMTKWIDA